MAFDIPIIEEKIKPHQITSLHLVCALAYIVAGTIIVVYNYTIPQWGALMLAAGLILLGTTIIKNKWILTSQNNIIIRVIEFLITVSFAVYSFLLQWKFPTLIFGVLSAVLLFAIFYERTASVSLFVCFADDGIHLPATSRKRFISWTEIEEVIFRYYTLSIDCTDNKFFQWTTKDININNIEFDAFCTNKIEESMDKRIKNNW